VIDVDAEMMRIVTGLQERGRALNQEFADSPAVLDALNKTMRKVDFGAFRIEVARAKDALAALGQETSVEAMLARLAEILTTGIPAGVKAADPEIQKLTQSMMGLKAWVDAVNGSVIALEQNLAGAGQAPSSGGLPNTGAAVVEE
jgi:hypothetical protein